MRLCSHFFACWKNNIKNETFVSDFFHFKVELYVNMWYDNDIVSAK